jgi:hypothetical protein
MLRMVSRQTRQNAVDGSTMEMKPKRVVHPDMLIRTGEDETNAEGDIELKGEAGDGKD